MTKVKICGITNDRDALLAARLGAWAVGFIFYRKSPRFIKATAARRIIDTLPPFVTPVGVFVNEKEAVVLKTAETCGLKTLQFHGDETPSYCRNFRRFQVIKTVRVGPSFRIQDIRHHHVKALLFDTFSSQCFGGCGQAFDWHLLIGIKGLGIPWVLSGGLNPANIREAIIAVQPYAVDVCSGVEKSPGVKSPKLMAEFLTKIPRSFNASAR